MRRGGDELKKQGVRYRAVKLGGDVFGIFFESALIEGDSELAAFAARNRSYSWRFSLRRLERWLRGG